MSQSDHRSDSNVTWWGWPCHQWYIALRLPVPQFMPRSCGFAITNVRTNIQDIMFWMSCNLRVLCFIEPKGVVVEISTIVHRAILTWCHPPLDSNMLWEEGAKFVVISNGYRWLGLIPLLTQPPKLHAIIIMCVLLLAQSQVNISVVQVYFQQ